MKTKFSRQHHDDANGGQRNANPTQRQRNANANPAGPWHECRRDVMNTMPND